MCGLASCRNAILLTWVCLLSLSYVGKAAPDVTRFIVLAEARTGSTLLVDSLDEHPEILAHKEVLREQNWNGNLIRESVRHLFMPGLSDAERQELQQNLSHNSTDYLNRLFELSAGAKAVGFKMFHWHLLWTEALKVLRDPSIKKIVLYRRNLLAKITSHQVAGITGKFHNRVTHEHIKVNVGYAVKSARATMAWYACVRDALGDQEYALVPYEELDTSFSAVMSRLTDFLGVAPGYDFVQAQKKQTVQPLEETATNGRAVVCCV